MNRKILLIIPVFFIFAVTPVFALVERAKPVMVKIDKFRGNVEAIGTDYLTVDGKKVEFDDKTRFLRKFGGKSDISEFSVGDGVQVVGTASAKLIRNFSVQKQHAVFIGTIKSLKPETAELVLATQKRGDQNVAPDKNTKYVNIKMKAIKFEDFQTGHRIRVKGTWDSKLNEIFEVTQIKDYSL